MPAPEYRDRFQSAVLWPALQPVETDDYGVIQVGTPVEVRVQWTDVLKEQQQPDGSTVTLDGEAKAWVPPNQDIPIGSHLWLGTLAQWLGSGSSGDDTEVRVVATRTRTPDPKNRNIGWKLGVMRWKNKQ